MTALPPAGHLRDEAVEADLRRVIDSLVGLCVHRPCPGPDEPFEDMVTCRVCAAVQDLRAVVAELVPAVVRALTEARADELEQAAHLLDDGDEQEIEVALGGSPYVHRVLCDRATHLRASIRQTDERNDR